MRTALEENYSPRQKIAENEPRGARVALVVISKLSGRGAGVGRGLRLRMIRSAAVDRTLRKYTATSSSGIGKSSGGNFSTRHGPDVFVRRK